MLAYCGIRWGEAIALRVRDVQFLRRRLSVHDNAVQIGVDHAVGQTKSRVERSVPVPSSSWTSYRCSARVKTWMIWCSATARVPAAAEVDGGWFARAVKRAGVQQITPHDLRHTCARSRSAPG